MAADHTGLEPQVEINPDEAVALGAGAQAAIIAGEPLDAAGVARRDLALPVVRRAGRTVGTLAVVELGILRLAGRVKLTTAD
jgi:molecular chaperone DnaK (HSP70)